MKKLTINDLPEEGGIYAKTKKEWEEVNHLYIHYFYKITNNINGKYYYGIHSILKEDPKSDDLINDGYWGSGSAIIWAENKYGLENFTKTIEKTFSTRADLRLYEAEIVTEDLINDRQCYNLALGGAGGNTVNMVTVNYRDPSKRLKKFFLISCEEYAENRDMYITTSYGKVVVNYRDPDKRLEKFFEIPKEEYYNNKDKYISFSSTFSGKVVCKNKDDFNDIRLLQKDDPLYTSGQYVGITKGTKIKTTRFGERNGSYGSFWITNGKESKRIKDQDIPEGWWKGKTRTESEINQRRAVKYTNRYTLEKRLLTKEEYLELKPDTWFTDAFFIRDRFIDYEYFSSLYKETPSLTRISKLIGKCRDSLRIVKNYYESKGKIFSSTNKLKRKKKHGD